jgi:hypothetical protein
MSQTPESMSLPARLLLGGLTTGMGLMIVGVAGGIVPVDPTTVYAPMWIIFTAGGMFTLVGLWMATAGTPVGDALNRVVGPVVLVGLLSILHWVAFGPGIRQCSGGISLPFLSTWGATGDLQCRLAFGYGALLFDGLIGGATLSSWGERRLTGTLQRVARGTGSVLMVVPLLPLLLLLLVVSLIKLGWAKVRGR